MYFGRIKYCYFITQISISVHLVFQFHSPVGKKKRMQNKFQAGSVIAVAGSLGMMGAASLACEAAYTVGAGYVRLLMSKDLIAT